MPKALHPQCGQNISKVIFSEPAKRRLDDLDLHGKDRERVKRKHRDIVQAHMEKISAYKAEIQYA